LLCFCYVSLLCFFVSFLKAVAPDPPRIWCFCWHCLCFRRVSFIFRFFSGSGEFVCACTVLSVRGDTVSGDGSRFADLGCLQWWLTLCSGRGRGGGCGSRWFGGLF
jgi:hypothetical protein